MTLEHDDAGNLLTRTDARGETVAMAYDPPPTTPTPNHTTTTKHNPKPSNTPPHTSTSPHLPTPHPPSLHTARIARSHGGTLEDEAGSRVTMRYDGCDAEECSNPEGLLSEVTYPGPGLERQGFDLRGRPIYFAREIDGHLFAQNNAFDNADRLRSSTYPDGQEIERRYDDAGRLTAIDGIVTAVEYDDRGQMVGLERADGSADTLEYDSRLRPTSLVTTLAAGAAQDLAFTRDRVGNLQRVADTSGEGPDTSVEYVHDAWYRTREAQLSIGGQDETLGWQFDTIDNIVVRTSSREGDAHGLTGAFTYDGAGPNAVTDAGDLVLEYDAAGDVTRRGDVALTWDYQGRLTAQGAGEEDDYGADVTRVKSRRDGSVTHYALADFDVRDGIGSLSCRGCASRVARLDGASLATTLAERTHQRR